jgi:hypothetical protein
VIKTDENPQFDLNQDHRVFYRNRSNCKDACKMGHANKGWTPESLREIPSRKTLSNG